MKQKKSATEKYRKQKEYENASRYMVYLLRGALNQTELIDSPVNCTWRMVWDLVKKNYMEALIGKYIQKYSEIVPEEIRNAGQKAYDATLYRQIYFEVEREKVVKELEEQKLAHLILKGINIAEYYPEAGTRWMSDNDILCGFIQMDDGEYHLKGKTEEELQYWKKQTQKAVQTVMEKCGYTLKEKGDCHDAYIKQPMFKFEMHHQLFKESFDDIKSQYYQNPWKRAIPDEKKPYRYYYSKEDEYLYFVTHAHKHFSVSGSGIRTLTDMYVYIKNNKSMDWNYILSQLKLLKLEDFEVLLRNTAIHVFDKEEKITTEEWNTVLYMIGSGIYGTSQNRIRHQLENLGVNKQNNRKKMWYYMKDRLWPNEEKMKKYYPFFYRHRYFRVIMPPYRVIRGILIHPGKLWTEWKILIRTVKSNS